MADNENIFESISNGDISIYMSASGVKKRETNAGQLFGKTADKAKTVNSQEELDTLIRQLSDFSLRLDPQNEDHKEFYQLIEDTVVNNAQFGSYQRLGESFGKLPTENKINYVLLSDQTTYIDEEQLAQENAPQKLSPKIENALLKTRDWTFSRLTPTICNIKCNEELRNRINKFILKDRSSKNAAVMLKKLDISYHNIETLKQLKNLDFSCFSAVTKKILNNDSLFHKIAKPNTMLPQTLSQRYDILAQAGEFQDNTNTFQLKNELVYSDIKAGKVDLLQSKSIAVLLSSGKHISDVIAKINTSKLDEVLKYAFDNRIDLPNNIMDKIHNKQLAESGDISKTLDMLNQSTSHISHKSSVKDHLERLKISTEKLAQIKDRPEYAQMQSTINTFDQMAEDVDKKADRRDVLNQASRLINKFQTLAANIAKYASPDKDGAIAPADIEKMIASAAAEKYEPLNHTEAKLPMLFGKDKEKNRQDALNYAIDQMNKSLKELSRYNRSIHDGAIEATLLEYSGKILDKETLEKVEADYQKAEVDLRQSAQDKKDFETYNNVSQKRYTLDKINSSEKQLEANRVAVNQENNVRLNKARTHLKANLGIDNSAGKSGVVKADDIAAKIIRAKSEHTQ